MLRLGCIERKKKKKGKTGGVGGPERATAHLGPLSRQRNFYRDMVSLALCRDRDLHVATGISMSRQGSPCRDRVLRHTRRFGLR